MIKEEETIDKTTLVIQSEISKLIVFLFDLTFHINESEIEKKLDLF